ncbi:hypothetical protein NOC27_1824 [Nitrosococcus oceani AFC27]|nr:hypothetical protein NOC27_1824 [Nitrosococcus oceani AFC27]
MSESAGVRSAPVASVSRQLQKQLYPLRVISGTDLFIFKYKLRMLSTKVLSIL